jgi:hypothetical protein
MKQTATFKNFTDTEGNPTGGFYYSTGIKIDWQNGPLGRDGDRLEPNGAFVENAVDAAMERLQHYQESHFACEENDQALRHLQAAAAWLDKRTKDREARKVEGTHTV